MIVTTLPEYTTERYYILSELEQKVSSFVYLDESNTTNDKISDTSNRNIKSYYLLWDLSKSDNNVISITFKAEIENLLRQHNNDNNNNIGGHNLLSIELLLGNRNDWDNVKLLLNDTMEWIASNYHNVVNYIVIGVADDAVAAPALDSILDYYNKICSEDVLSNYTVKIIGLSRSSFLGHSIDPSPDAKSGVFQLRACRPCSLKDESKQTQMIDFEAWCDSVSLVLPRKKNSSKEAEVLTWLAVLIAMFISWYFCFKN